jgi:hypothetical protein
VAALFYSEDYGGRLPPWRSGQGANEDLLNDIEFARYAFSGNAGGVRVPKRFPTTGFEVNNLGYLYAAGTPPASGGIWERAALVQALDAALSEGADPQTAAASLIAAERALRARGLDVAFAREYASALAEADWTGLEGPLLDNLIAILLLGGETPAAVRLAGETPDGFTRTLLTLAGAGGNPAPASDLQRAALSGLVALVPADEREMQLAGLADSGRRGEAVLGALRLLGNGETADPPALQTALFALRRAGLEPDARAVALQMILREAAGQVE